jgi:hypothetical protein
MQTYEERLRVLLRSLGMIRRRAMQENGITRGKLTLQLRYKDVEDINFMKVKAIVTEAKSYNVLVGTMVLCSMGFTLDLWEEIVLYKAGWQSRHGRKAQVLANNLINLYHFSRIVDGG